MKDIKDVNDIYGITNGFTDKERIDYFIYDLYESKYSKGLNEFWLCHMPKGTYKKVSEEKALDLTLEYLEPLLRDGKLKVRINDYEEKQDPDKKDNTYFYYFGGKEYFKKESKKAIKDIKEKWLSIDNTRERESFERSGIVFTLPENEWN